VMASKQRLIYWTLVGAQFLNFFLIAGLYGHAYVQLKVEFLINFSVHFSFSKLSNAKPRMRVRNEKCQI
jgi:hypothetical protein